MATREIPRQEWTRFFDGFSRDHLGQVVTLEILSRDLGDQVAADHQIFRGISADEKDGENRIAILVGPDMDKGITQNVPAPSEVWLKEGDDTADTLEIRTSDSGVWLLTFVSSELPSV
jgi:uncharacterized protein DUF5335